MGSISLTLPVSGTVITAGLHSSNYGTLQTVINGGLDNNNFAAGLIFDTQKLMQNGATTGQALVWNGTKWAPATAGAVTYRKTTAKAVNTTTAATDLFNGEITVAAGAQGATGVIRGKAWGDWLDNIGAATAPPPRFQILLGGATMIDTNTGGTITNDATRRAWELEFEILNLTASSQVVSFRLTMAISVNAATTVSFAVGTGSYLLINNGSFSMNVATGVNSGLAVNTAVANALVLNVINGSANAAYETRLLGALVEVI